MATVLVQVEDILPNVVAVIGRLDHVDVESLASARTVTAIQQATVTVKYDRDTLTADTDALDQRTKLGTMKQRIAVSHRVNLVVDCVDQFAGFDVEKCHAEAFGSAGSDARYDSTDSAVTL